MMRRSRLRLLSVALVLAASSMLRAAVPNRIAAISQGTRTEMPRSVSGRTKVSTDRGEAPAQTRLEGVTLHFSLTAAQQTALTQLLIDQQNPASPRYHHWLTPEQYGAQFGLSAADLARVTQWLTSQGLTVTSVARSGNLVIFSGTVAQIEVALGTSIHTVTLNGEQHIANVTNPRLPAGLAAVVSGITGLSDFRLKPRVHLSAQKSGGLKPDFTSSLTGSHSIAPGDFYTIYDVNPLLSGSINGTGITIAVMGQTDISAQDVAAFRSASGLPANAPVVRLVGADPGVSRNSNEIAEAQLDVEWSGAVAPSATILFVNSKDVLNTSLVDAIVNNVAPIISISYGICEPDSDAPTLDSFNQLFQEANAQGQTIVGPSGDSGATDCDFTSLQAADGLAVDYPASSPFVTGVGGTEFNEGTGTYWSATNGTTQGSATGYIPEEVWNDSAGAGLSAGGGGASLFFSKPAWQIGTGVPADFSRDVPDVSFSASPNHDPYLLCSSGSCTNGYRDSGDFLNTVGGTSVSTPAFAGVLALLEQKLGSRVGNANPVLYALANSTHASTVFHDVTSGNNASACIQGSPNCQNGGSIGYSATVGYDLASGWGSVDAFNMVNTWSAVTPAGSTSGIGSVISATTITSSAAPCGIATGSIALTLQVGNDSGTAVTAVPGGTVQILLDNVVVGTVIPLSNGSASYTLDTTTLSSGGHTISAAYSGDTVYAGSKGTLPIDVVSATAPDFSITPCNTTVNIVTGGTATGVTYTVQPFNGFTGPVAFSVSADASLAATYNFSVSPVTIGSGNGTTVLTLTASVTSGGAAIASARPAGPLNLRHESESGSHRQLYTAGSGAALAAMLLLVLPKRRRWGALLGVVVSVATMGSLGCGSGGTLTQNVGPTGTPTITNTAPATYYVSVTGIGTSSTGATLVHSARLKFVVTK